MAVNCLDVANSLQNKLWYSVISALEIRAVTLLKYNEIKTPVSQLITDRSVI